MGRLLALSFVLGLAMPPLAPAQEAPTPLGAKTWIGHEAAIEEYLRTAPIERIVDVGEGVTRPKRAFFSPGGPAGSALVKHLPPKRDRGFWESYKSEIAAYELDRLLELDMVPVTVERRIGGERASVQMWLSGCQLLRDLSSQKPTRPREWDKQVWRQRVFDALIANIDRNAGNILIDDEWNVILIDHSRAFATNEMPFEEEIERLDRELFERIKALDEATLMERLKPWVFGAGTVRAILKRRDKIVEKLEKLAKKRGEIAVFPF